MLAEFFTNPVVSFILLAGAVIFFHELGHYLVGRWLGIQAEEFSIGFGPKAFGFHKWGTDFKVSWLPIGGYVRFLGADLQAPIEDHLKEKSISHAKLYKRSLVSFAGPFFNFLLSILIMSILVFSGIPQAEPYIGVLPGGVAEKSGLKSGDKIIEISGTKIPSWGELVKVISSQPGKELEVHVEREGLPLRLKMVPATESLPNPFGEKESQGRIGISQYIPSAQLVIPKEGVLEQAGLKTGDLLKSINGVKVANLDEAQLLMESFSGAKNEFLWKQATPITPQGTPTANSLAWKEVKPIWKVVRPKSKSADGVIEYGKEELEFTLDRPTPSAEPIPTPPWARWAYSLDTKLAEPLNPKKTSATLKNAEDSWKQCGVKPGVTLIAARALAYPEVWDDLTTATLFGNWLQKKGDSLSSKDVNVDGASTSLGKFEFALISLAGQYFTQTCSLQPILITTQNLKKQWALPFPFRFEGQGNEPVWTTFKASGPVEALVLGTKRSWEQVESIFAGIRKLVTGSLPITSLGGGITIARVASDAASHGWMSFLLLMSWISINVGMLNLLPFPALDGGHLLLHFAEGAYGKPLSLKVQLAVQKAGVLFLIVLMAVVLFNDLRRAFLVD